MTAIPPRYEVPLTPAPDLAQAQRLITLLADAAGSDAEVFQTFDDSEGKAGSLVRCLHGTLEDHADELSRLNAAGAGVFVTVNATDDTGRRKADNVTHIRALFVDLDGAPLDPVMRGACEPQIVIESSPIRWHAYWLLSEPIPADAELFNRYQHALAARFGGDPSVCDLNRVMRLPGFWHRKDAPFQTRIVHESGASPYSLAELVAAFDLDAVPAIAGLRPEVVEAGRHSDLLKLTARLARDGLSASAIRAAIDVEVTEGRWTRHMPADEIDRAISGAVTKFAQKADAPASWSTPLNIFGNLEPVPFPLDCMPRVIADFASDQAELMGGDPGVVALAALAVIAGCCDDRVMIQPKRHDPTWTESARIWFAAVGDPSSMKSPLLKKAMGPAFKHEADWQKDNARKLDDYNRRLREWKKAGEEGKPPSMPILNRLVLSDVTVEKMADILSKADPRGVIVFRDELSGWLSSMDCYKSGGGKDRAAWLEAFNGGPLSVDRVNRGSTHVANWSANVIGGIQPSVVQEYATATNHDGMLQRFVLYYAQPAAMGQDRAPDRRAKQAFWQTVATVLDIPESDEPIRLDDDAHAVKDELWERLHRLTAAHPNLFLTAALGKWRGLSARLMLALHVAECTSEGRNPHAERVSRRTAENVATILWDCLLPHAIKFYQALDPAEDKARQVAGLVLAQGWDRFTVKRDLDRYLRASRGWKPWEADETCARLDSFGWLMPEPEGRLNERGRPAAYLVNPLVHERFADVAQGERNRREEVTALLRGIKP
tara:strand:+ start:9125 stop:11446 length:2322 start_codon:yes stop_codon:yes gene_type:complete